MDGTTCFVGLGLGPESAGLGKCKYMSSQCVCPEELLSFKVSATQKAGCRGGQAFAGNRGGLRYGDARQGAAAKSGPV